MYLLCFNLPPLSSVLFVSLITLRVLEPAHARCKNSNKFGFRSLTRSFDFVSTFNPFAFQALPLGKWESFDLRFWK